MSYFGTQHERTLRREVARHVVCRVCGKTNEVIVDAAGKGSSFSFFGVDEAGVEREADEDAAIDLEASAARRALLRRCAACNAIPAQARRRHVAIALGRGIAIAAPFAGLAGFLGARLQHAEGALGAAVLGLAFAGHAIAGRIGELFDELDR
jgi:hypothetical protein